MRLTTLKVEGFRGFASGQTFDLDADAVVVVGANGQGKTSFFDAILWCLTGSVSRLGEEKGRVVSMYSETGQARVELTLRDEENSLLRVTRSCDGLSDKVSLERDRQDLQGTAAIARLLECIWPDALLSIDGSTALSAAITRSVYLQQDLLRQFVGADTDQQRFAAVSELVGTGRVTELQVHLERARNAWSRATTQVARDRDSALQRVARLEEQLRRLAQASDVTSDLTEQSWAHWWSASAMCGLQIGVPVALGSAEAPALLDTALRQLDALRRSAERQRDEILSELKDLAEAPPRPLLSVDNLRSAVEEAESRRGSAQASVMAAESRTSELRQAQVATRQKEEQLRALAQIAMEHLGDSCPVCQQSYDIEATRRRLEAMAVQRTVAGEVRPVERAELELAAASNLLSRAEQDLLDARDELQRGESTAHAWEMWNARIQKTTGAIDIQASQDLRAVLEKSVNAQELRIARLAEQRQLGERIALALTRAAELSRREEVRHELNSANEQLAKVEQVLTRREATGELVGTVIGELREATSDVVSEQLQQVEPLLQRLYSTVDPHPSFRVVKLLSRFSRGRGHLLAQLQDPEVGVSTDFPPGILSSSQLNALAISTFLALNLGLRRPPLNAILLDDPFQSLDDINLLGLVDLLRRFKDRRQVIVSTHNPTFGQLLSRKLRPGVEGQRTCYVELHSWYREGQSVRQSDVPRDPAPLRIVA